MQAGLDVVLQGSETEVIEFKRISDNKNILYISNIPAKFHEDELQVNYEFLYYRPFVCGCVCVVSNSQNNIWFIPKKPITDNGKIINIHINSLCKNSTV